MLVHTVKRLCRLPDLMQTIFRQGKKVPRCVASVLTAKLETRHNCLTPHLAFRCGGYCVTSIFTAVVMACQCLISPSSQIFASASDLLGTTLKFCLLSFSIASGELSALFTAANSASSTGFGVAAGANRPFQATVPTSGYPTSFMVGMSGYSLSRS